MAAITPKMPAPHGETFEGDIAVFRPADREWGETSLEPLQPQDMLYKDDAAYHVSAAFDAGPERVQNIRIPALLMGDFAGLVLCPVWQGGGDRERAPCAYPAPASLSAA